MQASRLGVLLDDQRRRVAARDTESWQAKAQRLVDSCHPKQRAFVEDDGKRIAALTSRGCGKTTGSRARLLRRMLLTPNARCLYIATTRTQAEELMWAPLKDVVEKLGCGAKWNETKLKLTLPANGSELRLVGADNKREIEKVRGLPHHEVDIDEAASHDQRILEHLVYRVIEPRLGDYDGVLTLTGTPGSILQGIFYDITRPGSEMGGWSVHQWGLGDGAEHVPAMRQLWQVGLRNKEANGWSDDNPVWLREYLGRWAADDTEHVYRYRPHLDDGAEWNQWDPPRDPNTGLAVLPKGHEWRFVYGMDMGHSDPFALQVFAYSLTSRTLFHVYEFGKKGMYARTIAEQLIGEGLDADSPDGVIGATRWPDGMVADTAGLGGMLLDELRNVYGIHIEPAEKKNKHDAIELFNGDLIDGRIKVLKGSKLETQLLHLQWAVDQYGKLKEDRNQENDAADGAVYARRHAMHLFADESEPVGPKPGTPEARDLAHEEPDEPDEGMGEFDDLLDDGNYDWMWG